jgi:hypothetical protein
MAMGCEGEGVAAGSEVGLVIFACVKNLLAVIEFLMFIAEWTIKQ